jgi:uncharacterized membrane protein YhaH (DUF805 family)
MALLGKQGVAMELMFAPFMRYAEFSGRSRRKEYWLFTVLYTAVTSALLMGFLGAVVANQGVTGLSTGALNFFTLFVFWTLATFIPHLALCVRRLHDINMSGWVYLINFIPFGGLVFFVMMFIDGTNGPNGYGPDPKGRGDGYWWEGDGGPPEGYRQPARATGGDMREPASAPSYPASGGFGRRAASFGSSNAEMASMSREEWLKRLDQN